MTTPDQYREFALDCLRWTEEAKDAAQRNTLVEIARLWSNAAFQLERHIVVADDPSMLQHQLRAKLE